jgi:hypothetical protein
MSPPIDSVRRAARLRRAARVEAERTDEAQTPERAALPVPVDASHASPRVELPPAAAAFDAQLLGQDGEKRGLRAGPQAIDKAKASYNRIEWSGSKDRRSRKGRYKTEI